MKLSREGRRCEAGEEYSFSDCVNTRLALMAGCQTIWTNFTGIPTCSNWTQLNGYISLYVDFMVSREEKQLLNETKCLGGFWETVI